MNDEFESCVMICQNCGHETAIDPNRTIGAIIPLEFCPWCGKEIKEAEDETEKRKSAGRVKYSKRRSMQSGHSTGQSS